MRGVHASLARTQEGLGKGCACLPLYSLRVGHKPAFFVLEGECVLVLTQEGYILKISLSLT